MSTEKKKLLSFEDVDLYMCDIHPLTISGGWLTDNTMNFGACYLMKKFTEINPTIKDKVNKKIFKLLHFLFRFA